MSFANLLLDEGSKQYAEQCHVFFFCKDIQLFLLQQNVNYTHQKGT